MDKLNNKLAEEWFAAGESDFLYAEVGLKENEVYPQIAFLSQQSAEKYLKGFLILNGIEPPRTHDLPMLLDRCLKINPALENLREACELLSGFYLESRYPPDIPDYTEEEITEAFNCGKLVKETIEKIAP